jgi:hypothetical protein
MKLLDVADLSYTLKREFTKEDMKGVVRIPLYNSCLSTMFFVCRELNFYFEVPKPPRRKPK